MLVAGFRWKQMEHFYIYDMHYKIYGGGGDICIIQKKRFSLGHGEWGMETGVDFYSKLTQLTTHIPTPSFSVDTIDCKL